jgi:hypothetical protein
VPYPTAFSITTDALGNIVRWDINVYSVGNNDVGWNEEITSCYGASSCNGGNAYDNVNIAYNYDAYNNGGNGPGQWTASALPTETPEPGSMVLMGSGALAMMGSLRRKFRK